MSATPLDSTKKDPKARLHALDQFRGYAVAAMIAVNFLGGFACTPRILRHTNDYCSYADTIMPHFLFAVGFAMAIVWGRISPTDPASRRRIVLRLARRSVMLMLVAFLVYFPWDDPHLSTALGTADFWFAFGKRDWFQTLTHIAVTTLWMLPALGARWPWRLAWILGGACLHLVLSHVFYFHWVHSAPGAIDGGPLGFLTWSLSAWVGVWAGEGLIKMQREQSQGGLGLDNPRTRSRWLAVALLLMGMGYAASCLTRRFDRVEIHPDLVPATAMEKLATSPVFGREHPRGHPEHASWRNQFAEPPLVPPPPYSVRAWNYWMMSQKGGTLSYQVFAAGLSLLVFLGFDGWIRRTGHEIGLFRTLGRNAILCYVLHGYIIAWVSSLLRPDSPVLLVLAGFAGAMLPVYMMARWLEWRGIFLRL